MKLNKEDLSLFKKLYNKAIKSNKEIFIFKEQEVLVAYAKYVIEYNQLNK